MSKKLPLPSVAKFNASRWLEWVLPRPQGDITVFAPTREWAAAEIRANGFECDEKRLVMYDRLLTDVLHRKGIS